MTLDLRITFHGTARGLQTHSLSLVAFAHPLERLVTALQRTATALLKDRDDQPLGPIATKARELDLQVTSLEHNCVSLTMQFVGPSDALEPQDNEDLAQRAVSKLLSDIENEANGREVSEAARRYVRSLPDGMTTQTYRLSRDGVTIAASWSTLGDRVSSRIHRRRKAAGKSRSPLLVITIIGNA